MGHFQLTHFPWSAILSLTSLCSVQYSHLRNTPYRTLESRDPNRTAACLSAERIGASRVNRLSKKAEISSAFINSEAIVLREESTDWLNSFVHSGYLYAIVDACGAPAVPPKMQQLGQTKAQSLFKGSAQESYWAVAPYLARVKTSLSLLDIGNPGRGAMGHLCAFQSQPGNSASTFPAFSHGKSP